jgi:hypothetical protein
MAGRWVGGGVGKPSSSADELGSGGKSPVKRRVAIHFTFTCISEYFHHTAIMVCKAIQVRNIKGIFRNYRFPLT